MDYRAELVLLFAATAAACAVPGVFLVLRRTALVADATSHVLLFGIVVAYLIFKDVDSPWLFFGAAASGVLTVALVEALQLSSLVRQDAAIGLVFPALFAAGAILLTMFVPRSTHLDVDQVLLGNEVYSVSANRLILFGQDWMPKGTALLTGMFLLNSGLVLLFYKELKLATFDAPLAAALGFLPVVLHYGLMTLVSITAVAAFDAVGPVVVVALFVVPPATAYLLTDRLSRMLLFSVVIGLVGAVLGSILALLINTNVAGTVATVLGLMFGIAWMVVEVQKVMLIWQKPTGRSRWA